MATHITALTNSTKAVLLYYASLVGYFRAMWLGMTHAIQIMLLNCENIEKHTWKMLDIDYEKLSSLSDTLLVSISESQQNNVLKLAEGIADERHKNLACAMLKAVGQQIKEGICV